MKIVRIFQTLLQTPTALIGRSVTLGVITFVTFPYILFGIKYIYFNTVSENKLQEN